MRPVERRHKAGFGAAGLGTAQSWFWSRHKAGFAAVGLGSAQSRFWSRHKAGFGGVGLGSAQSRFWSRHKARFGGVGLGSAQSRFWSRHKAHFGGVGLGLAQSRFWSRHKAGFGAVGLGSAQSRFWSWQKAGLGVAGYKTGLVSRQVLHLLSKLQNWIWHKTGQYKTCLVSNTKIEASIRATKPKSWQSHLTSETVEIFIQNEKAGLVPMQSRFWCGRLSVGTKPGLVQQV